MITIINTKIKDFVNMIEFYDELLYFIKKKTRNPDIAEDILHDTYTRIISLQEKKTIENKRAFLYKIAKNIIIDEIRKKSKKREIPYEENKIAFQYAQPEEIAIEHNRTTILMKELKKLPAMRKEAFVLHVLEGYTRQEIADIMGISLHAVDKHISRASIELKRRLKEEDDS